MIRSREVLANLATPCRDPARSIHLFLFGSAARDEMGEGSDVDVLVEFEGPATFRGYFDLKDYLETLLGRTVDLVTERGLKPRARRHVERDLIRVA
jgi:predicted nucleotidyltransferase